MLTVSVLKNLTTQKFVLNIATYSALDGEIFNCELAPSPLNYGLGGALSRDKIIALRDYLTDMLN